MSVRREIESMLERSGAPWEIRTGKKHHKIYVRDRMVAVFSLGTRSDKGRHGLRNIEANIMREARSGKA